MLILIADCNKNKVRYGISHIYLYTIKYLKSKNCNKKHYSTKINAIFLIVLFIIRHLVKRFQGFDPGFNL